MKAYAALPNLASAHEQGLATACNGTSRRCASPTAHREAKPSHRQSKYVAVAHDRATHEVAGQDERWRPGKTGEQLVAGAYRLRRIEIDGRAPVEVHHLTGVVRDITDEKGILAPRPDVDTEVARRASGRRDHAHL